MAPTSGPLHVFLDCNGFFQNKSPFVEASLSWMKILGIMCFTLMAKALINILYEAFKRVTGLQQIMGSSSLGMGISFFVDTGPQ